MESNYEKMKRRAQEQFASRGCRDAVRVFALAERGDELEFGFFGSRCRIGRETGAVRCADVLTGRMREADFNEALTVYDLFSSAERDPRPAGHFVSMQSLPRSMSAEFHASPQSFFHSDAKRFDGRTSQLRRALQMLGGRLTDGADLSAVIEVFAGLSVLFRFWESDEEFEPQIQFYWDANVLDYLHYETVWYANLVLMARLVRLFDAERIHGGRQPGCGPAGAGAESDPSAPDDKTDPGVPHAEGGRRILDFSANVSPLGLPDGAREAAVRSIGEADAYPDPECTRLRRAIAAHLQKEGYAADPEHLLAGCGAAGLIDRLAAALGAERVLLTAPTFGEYRPAFLRAGAEVLEYPLFEKNGFSVGEELLRVLDQKRPDALILCEPNNPTGRTTEPALLHRIADRCRESGIALIADECFHDFLDEPETHTLMGRVFPADASSGGPPLLILRAFTKFYAMAGLRLGWCACTDRRLLERMKNAGQPWEVSGPAMAAGEAALADGEYAARLRALIRRERARLAEGLRKAGFAVIPGEANYLLFRGGRPDLDGRLKEMGILIRNCGDYPGLSRDWYRTAVRTEEENDRLLAELREAR